MSISVYLFFVLTMKTRMNQDIEQQTAMYREAKEAPDYVRWQLDSNKGPISELAADLRREKPTLIVICARGSSGNAAVYAKYLIETQLKIPVLLSSPSISSIYTAKQNYVGHVVFLAISQSGQSPDLLMATRSARDSGAKIISIVNDTKSPLANTSDVVIPICAGVEKSVAATKTFICTLSAIINLVAEWRQNDELLRELTTLPALLKTAYAKDWREGLNKLMNVTNLFVVSRGLALGVAQEAALKLKETCGIHAEAFSAAEIKHGPMAIVQKGFLVFIYSPQDQSQESINDMAVAFLERGAQVLSVGQHYQHALNLESTVTCSPPLRPLLFIQSFYKFANALSLARGYNPDSPPHLNKITETI